MSEPGQGPFPGFRRWLRALPMAAKATGAVLVLGGLVVASVFGYRTYDYVQHDNEFCLECHLMREPFERFAQSAHRGLGCKACHRPNIIQRSEMGLTQILEQPDTIATHANVPNEVCAECHIEDDREKWIRIARSAGHRVHLESEEPGMDGLMCVECHSTSLHQFAPTDQTCGQAGCHEDSAVELGAMTDLTIHCVACHDFTEPLPRDAGSEVVATALRPQAEECLSCHAMRQMLASLPDDEPHEAECGACHNPHQQTTPQQAVESCAAAGCHTQPTESTPFHRGLDTGVLEDCTACHDAHDWRLDGDNCLACHSDVFDEDATQAARSTRPAAHPVARQAGDAAVRPVAHPATRPAAAAQPAGMLPAAWAAALAERPVRQQAQEPLRFRHGQHRNVSCESCHNASRTHGGLTVTGVRDCRSCHHREPVSADCGDCHDRADAPRQSLTVRRTLPISLGRLDNPTRDLPFDHAVHETVDCQRCHTEGLALGAAGVSCRDCHVQHHEPDAQCSACHDATREGAHTVDVHLGCAGAGCHQNVPVEGVPRARTFCLGCHQDMTEHRPDRRCEDCHTLPEPRTASTATPGGVVAGLPEGHPILDRQANGEGP